AGAGRPHGQAGQARRGLGPGRARDRRRDPRAGAGMSDARRGRGPSGHRGPRQRSRTAPAQRSRRGDPPRSVARGARRAVADGAYANLELPAALRGARIAGRAAAVATELAVGALRMEGCYDAVIAEAARRPTSRRDGPGLDVLRLGAHQVLGMRVPEHAAADQSVALARAVA